MFLISDIIHLEPSQSQLETRHRHDNKMNQYLGIKMGGARPWECYIMFCFVFDSILSTHKTTTTSYYAQINKLHLLFLCVVVAKND